MHIMMVKYIFILFIFFVTSIILFNFVKCDIIYNFPLFSLYYIQIPCVSMCLFKFHVFPAAKVGGGWQV